MMLLIGIDIKVDVVIIAEAIYDLSNVYPNVHIEVSKGMYNENNLISVIHQMDGKKLI